MTTNKNIQKQKYSLWDQVRFNASIYLYIYVFRSSILVALGSALEENSFD
jgi:hypothetical protein